MKRVIRISSGCLVLLTCVLSLTSMPSASAASCTPPATTYGVDTMTVSIPNATTYSIWVQMQAPATTSNSILLQVNSSTCFSVGGSSSMPLNSWDWVNYQNGSTAQSIQMALPAGNSTFKLTGTDPGVLIGSILVLGDTSCVPTGAGTNCTTGQPNSTTGSTTSTTTGSGSQTPGGTINSAGSSFGSPAANNSGLAANGALTPENGTTTTVSSSLTIEPSYVDGLTIKDVYYYLNHKQVYLATKTPFTYRLNTDRLENGKYLLSTKTDYTDGTSKTVSEYIVVNHFIAKNVAIYFLNNLLLIVSLVLFIGLITWRFLPRHRHLKSLVGMFKPAQNELAVEIATPPVGAPYTTPEVGSIIKPTIIAPTSSPPSSSSNNTEDHPRAL